MTALFLNGCTSAGKSSIARALQSILRTPHCALGIDDAFAMFPPFRHNHPDGFFFDRDNEGLVRLNLGGFGWRVIEAHCAMSALFILRGTDLILDEVVLSNRLEDTWRRALDELPVFYVTIRCALEELERRERERGNRIVGQARGQFGHVTQRMNGDFTVDTTHLSSEETASQIARAYNEWLLPT